MRSRSLAEFKERLLDLRPIYSAEGKAIERIPIPAMDESAAAALLAESVHGWLRMGLEAAAAEEPGLRAVAANADDMPPLELARDADLIASGFDLAWVSDLTAASLVALGMPAEPKAMGRASAESLFAFCAGTDADLVAEAGDALS